MKARSIGKECFKRNKKNKSQLNIILKEIRNNAEHQFHYAFRKFL